MEKLNKQLKTICISIEGESKCRFEGRIDQYGTIYSKDGQEIICQDGKFMEYSTDDCSYCMENNTKEVEVELFILNETKKADIQKQFNKMNQFNQFEIYNQDLDRNFEQKSTNKYLTSVNLLYHSPDYSEITCEGDFLGERFFDPMDKLTNCPKEEFNQCFFLNNVYVSEPSIWSNNQCIDKITLQLPFEKKVTLYCIFNKEGYLMNKDNMEWPFSISGKNDKLFNDILKNNQKLRIDDVIFLIHLKYKDDPDFILDEMTDEKKFNQMFNDWIKKMTNNKNMDLIFVNNENKKKYNINFPD